jgi:hypothetical protein
MRDAFSFSGLLIYLLSSTTKWMVKSKNRLEKYNIQGIYAAAAVIELFLTFRFSFISLSFL